MIRHIARILICLLLGAIVNVGVAWGCAWWGEVEEVELCATLINITQRSQDNGLDCENWWILLSRDSTFGLRRNQIALLLWTTDDEDAGTTNAIAVSVDVSNPDYTSSELQQIPVRRIWWSRMRNYDVRDSYFGVDTEYAAGWPAPALWRGIGCDDSLLPPETIWFSKVVDGSTRILPLCPIWRGCAANSVFYGAVIWFLLGGPLVLRHALRQRRGLCTTCGYELCGTAHERCPECGASTPAPPPASRTMTP